jgi:ribosomal protein S12 methylthiotransferase
VIVYFHLINLGCPKNAVDAEGMAMRLQAAGHRPARSERQADVIIVNTCGFIAAARAESLAALRQAARGKRAGQALIAAGCLAQREGAALAARVPGVDGYIGTRHWSQIVPLVEEVAQRGGRGPACTAMAGPGDPVAPMERVASGATAYLKIADGCDALCAFCAIPMLKGRQRSKPRDAILAEARTLVDQGVRELVLIAQDTTAYGQDLGDEEGLAGLLCALLAEVPELVWLRLMYAYPQRIDAQLIDLLASDPRICHYLDLPLQHAHPDVLRRMRRPHDPQRVERLIGQLRAAMPGFALRTTFIVGFPGETEAEFQALLDFMGAIEFDRVGVFMYSRERGTVAAGLPEQVAPRVRQERYDRAMIHQQAISLRRNQALVGRTLPVLVEGAQEGISAGRSYRDAPEIDGLVLLEGAWPAGGFVPVTITRGLEYDLVGTAAREPVP